MQCWRLDDGRQSLVLSSRGGRMPSVTYWGARLPDEETLSHLADAADPDITGGMLDVTPELSICPQSGAAFPGQPGLAIRSDTGTVQHPNFALDRVEPEERGLKILAMDSELGLNYTATIEIDQDTHVLTLSARLSSVAPVIVEWFAAPVLPASPHGKAITDFTGRWCGEFQMAETAWSPGIRLRENRTGRTGHEHFPGVILKNPGSTCSDGEVWGLHYGWSGGHRMIAEELPDGRRQIQFGHAAGSHSFPGTSFETAPVYATYGPHGLNGVATAFQRHLRDKIVTWPKPGKPRPVHYNCWEAVYFDHDLENLKDIASRAAALGAERFVLDDGWFGVRDDDTSSLGDWEVDARKYPDGLGPLIDHVHSLGMGFGLWFEPEMVNPDSHLYRAHPDWVLGSADQPLGRHQLVLDMAREDVRDHLFSKISALLSAHPIEYIKWDHNRVLPAPDGEQTHGTYALIEALRAAFPDVEIESCASGGGRIDFGILSRTQRVWLSDSNDALERLKIQHNAALFLPAAVTGSHVGPRICHTSARTLDIRIRAWVAAQRHMGFEMDPRELTSEEADVLAFVTAWWKSNRDWMYHADILRLENSDPAVVAEQQLARDGSRFVVFSGRLDTSSQIASKPLRLTQLDPSATYRIELVNKDDGHKQSRAALALKAGQIELSGQALMSQGLSLPWSPPETIWVLEGERV